MMLTELTPIGESALPVQALKDHLRLGTGFSDDDLQDGLLGAHLRAALATIEGRTAKVLLQRRFLWQTERWRSRQAQALPVAPVTSVVSVALVSGSEAPVPLPPGTWQLEPDLHRPKLAATGLLLPEVPMNGRAEVVFDAGFAPDWGGLPPDLAHAVLLLAAEYYEARHNAPQAAGLPGPVLALIERWRTVRVLGGGGR